MKLWGKFFLAIFALSLLSYGISGAAYAAVEPLSVTTNKEFYAEGGTITISGFVRILTRLIHRKEWMLQLSSLHQMGIL